MLWPARMASMAPSATTGSGRVGVADALRQVDAAGGLAEDGHGADLGLDDRRGDVTELKARGGCRHDLSCSVSLRAAVGGGTPPPGCYVLESRFRWGLSLKSRFFRVFL